MIMMTVTATIVVAIEAEAATGEDAVSHAYRWLRSELSRAREQRPAEAERIAREVAAEISRTAEQVPRYRPGRNH